jgi:hypothetical protein
VAKNYRRKNWRKNGRLFVQNTASFCKKFGIKTLFLKEKYPIFLAGNWRENRRKKCDHNIDLSFDNSLLDSWVDFLTFDDKAVF